MAAEDRTVVDFPKVADGDERTVVASFVLPKTGASFRTQPRPAKNPTAPPWQERTSYFHAQPPRPVATPVPAPAPREVKRATPVPASLRIASRPNLVPPAPPSGTNLHTNLPLPPPPPPPAVIVEPAPSAPRSMHIETPSAPALVCDPRDSTIPPAPRPKIGREPMLFAAAGLGVVGMIFAFGIVVGIVLSLRPRGEASAASSGEARSAPVAAAAFVASPAIAAPAVEPVALSPRAVEPVKVEAPKVTPKPVVAAEPVKVAAAPVAHAARVSLAAAVPKPEVAPKRVKIGSPSDPDFDAASAANALARAQLEASLR
jgi:hypothetical protein